MQRNDHAPETPATRFLRHRPLEPSLRIRGARRHARLGARAERRRACRGEDAGDGGRGRQAADRADARRPQGVDQEPGAADRREKRLALQARSRATPHRLPGGRHFPFGTKKRLPVYIEKTILDLPLIYINGGRRGFLVGVQPHEIVRVLQPKEVNCGLAD
jgi:hypothetical protein